MIFDVPPGPQALGGFCIACNAGEFQSVCWHPATAPSAIAIIIHVNIMRMSSLPTRISPRQRVLQSSILFEPPGPHELGGLSIA